MSNNDKKFDSSNCPIRRALESKRRGYDEALKRIVDQSEAGKKVRKDAGQH